MQSLSAKLARTLAKNHPVAACLMAVGFSLSISPVMAEESSQQPRSGFLLNSVFMSIDVGQPTEALPVLIRDSESASDCFWHGAVELDPKAFRAHIDITRRSCVGEDGQSEDHPIQGSVIAEDGFAGLPINCTSVYQNDVGRRLCLQADVHAGANIAVLPSTETPSTITYSGE